MQLLRDHHPKKEPPTALQAELDDWTLQYCLSVSILIVFLVFAVFSGLVVLLLLAAPHQSDVDVNTWPASIICLITALFSTLWWSIWLRPARKRMRRAKEAVENQGRIMVVDAPYMRECKNEAAIAAFREQLEEWDEVL